MIQLAIAITNWSYTTILIVVYTCDNALTYMLKGGIMEPYAFAEVIQTGSVEYG